MVYAQPGIFPRELDAQKSLGFWDKTGQPNLGQTARPSVSQQKKNNLWSMKVVGWLGFMAYQPLLVI